ncbi:long-chain-fatty-acid--CoA ligase [Nocardioides sp. 31GB23]|uniref:long-chain-fatty-acid--CoA ligase n=1 Tax=Nocardioides sp. 31GB23 TaxID=3156065 RepID=UPI0032AF798E
MQSRPLSVAHVVERAESMFGHKRIVSAGDETLTFRAWAGRVRRLVTALDSLEVPEGATVGTLAANHRRHLELYAAAPVSKRVLHTINTRLPAEHLEHVIADAGDDVVFVDRAHLAGVWAGVRHLGVRHWVVLPDGTTADLPQDPRISHYEDLLAVSAPREGSFEDDFSRDDEDLAAGLCYTSGTTGPPKGVVYSHRSTLLHSMGTMLAGYIGLHERDVVLPIVPMFHANAWGLPYGALLAGADLVLPGRSSDPAHLLALMDSERVTVAAAVPTVWTSLVPGLAGTARGAVRLLLAGGSAVAPALSRAYEEAWGLPLTHSWGMTEVSPVGAVGGLRSEHDALDPVSREEALAAQGQPLPLVRVRVVDVESGAPQPWDGASAGELQVAGPWVASAYLHRATTESHTDDGWLRTGDIATLDASGTVRLVDRLKDLIKSGGEWISSAELESAIGSHPEVDEVAVVARPDPRWMERPVAYVVRRAGSALTAEQVKSHIAPTVARWWVPDEVVFVDSLPKTGTGKLAKAELRAALR